MQEKSPICGQDTPLAIDLLLHHCLDGSQHLIHDILYTVKNLILDT